MSEVQAIPDNLFSYSDKTTGANTDLQGWISGVLAPEIQLYQATALDFGNDIYDLTARDGGSVDVDAGRVLSAISATDKQVRPIGQAFLDAGDKGEGTVQFPAWLRQHPVPGGDPNRYGIVTTTDAAISGDLTDQQAQQAQQAVDDLVAYMRTHGMDDHVLAELKKYQNDPVFLEAFFSPPNEALILIEMEGGNNGLTPPDAVQYVPAIAQAFATLFRGGPNSTTRAVADYMAEIIGYYPEFEKYFVSDLKSDHQAALAFMNSLTDWDLHELAQGYDSSGHVVESLLSCYDLMAIASSAMLACTPAQADALYARIAGPGGFLADIRDVSPPDLNTLLPEFAAFLANYASVGLGPPPPGQDPTAWATGVGAFLHDKMQPFLNFIASRYGRDTDASDISIGFMIDVMFTLLTMPLDGVGGYVIVLSLAFLEDVVLPLLEKSFESTGNPLSAADQLKQAGRAIAQLYVLTQLAMAGRLYKNGKPATAADIQQLLKEVTPDLNQGKQGAAASLLEVMADWTVDGPHGTNLYAFMATAGIGVDSTD